MESTQKGDAAAYSIEVFVDDDGTPSLGDSEAFTLTVTASGSSVFQQDAGGLLVMEPENFGENVGGTSVGSWAVINEAGASNAVAIKASSGGITGPPDTAQTSYDANIVVPGTHFIWIRFRSFNSGSDSVYAEVDSLGDQKLTLNPITGNWDWIRFGSSVSLTAGVHTFKLQRRERDAEIDKIVVTPDAGFTPTGLGPPESPTQ